MNVLIFVISLLMMLALLTYGRLDMYRNFSITQLEFERYMVEDQRKAINKGAEQWYQWTTVSTKNGKNTSRAPSDSTPKLNITTLLDTDKRNQDPALAAIQKELLKRLIYHIYGDQGSFKKAVDKNPQVIDDLIQAIELAGDQLAKEDKVFKSTDILEKLDLHNPSLQEFYYRLLKGYRLPAKQRDANTGKSPPTNSEEMILNNNEDQADGSYEEYIPQDKKISLLNYVTLNPKKIKLRVYLAPKPLLFAIFGDSQTVDEVQQTRLNLYHQMMSQEDAKNLTEEFKQKFKSRTKDVPEKMLDFTVTSSDPRYYEAR